ncbi:MAG TPA: hypothetical protein VNJ71_05020 [Gemmatimonadales bacterium]|jgi:hypothetical protein|nr:hypothetical protein [Gemmatimonadales bacterium]
MQGLGILRIVEAGSRVPEVSQVGLGHQPDRLGGRALEEGAGELHARAGESDGSIG